MWQAHGHKRSASGERQAASSYIAIFSTSTTITRVDGLNYNFAAVLLCCCHMHHHHHYTCVAQCKLLFVLSLRRVVLLVVLWLVDWSAGWLVYSFSKHSPLHLTLSGNERAH